MLGRYVSDTTGSLRMKRRAGAVCLIAAGQLANSAAISLGGCDAGDGFVYCELNTRAHCGACGRACPNRDDMCLEGECVADRNLALWPIPQPPFGDDYEVQEETVLDTVTNLEWQRHVGERIPDGEVLH